LNVVTISLPPLREKKEDIPLLADFFLRRACQSVKKPLMKISAEAMEHLMGYRWPGNARELGNLIERAVVLARGAEITPEDLPLLRVPTSSGESHLGKPYHDAVRHAQREVIRHALQTSGGNQARAAELLGLQRTYLARLIKKLDLKP
jgi:DNA-binding NtrC family response regulator